MNKSLVLVMCDVLVLSAMSLSNGGFGDNKGRQQQVGVEDAVPSVQEEVARARADARKARADATQAQEDAKRAQDDARRAREETALAKEGKAAAERESAEAKVAVGLAQEDAKRAQDDARRAREDCERIDQEYGVPGRAQKAREHMIWSSSSRITVCFSNEKSETFYSPIVIVEGQAFVMHRYKEKALGKVSRVSVERDGRIYQSDESYYYKDKGRDKEHELNIVFFKILGYDREDGLTLGSSSKEDVSHHIPFFWVSAHTGRARFAPTVSSSFREAISDYGEILAGDVLVDSGTASIVALALSRGWWSDPINVKGVHRFNKEVTMRDLELFAKDKMP